MKDKSTDLVSVIVPVYNVENYLSECIDSILGQSYKEIEIILINDGSTDNSKRLCEFYEKNYNNIRLINQINKGLSYARNIGINFSKGEYITFIDSDDLINSDMIKILYDILKKHDVPMSICKYSTIKSIITSNNKLKDVSSAIIDDEDFMKLMLSEQELCTAWGKLYKKDLFINSNITYPVNKLMEDMFVTPILAQKSRLLAITQAKLYYYNQDGSSITRSKFNKKKLDIVLATKFWINLVKKYYPSLEFEARIKHLITIINLCIIIINDDITKFRKEFDKLRLLLIDNKIIILNTDKINIKDKAKFVLIYFKQIKFIQYIYKFKND